MSDPISSIKYIPPTYPVKPTQPAQKDRQTDRRKKPKYEPPERENHDPDDHDEDYKPTIDEHV